MQHEITERGDLLDAGGSVREPGWARKLLLRYDRADIKAAKYRIKEWDYYLIANAQQAVALTIADNGYMGLVSASVLDFVTAREHTETVMTAAPMGKFGMAADSDGDAFYGDKRVQMSFRRTETGRRLDCRFGSYFEGNTLEFGCDLTQPDCDTMVIATPFEKPRAFYYNQKINCMPAEGKAVVGTREYVFHAGDSFGTLDWGRGVWTYDNTWYWGSGNGRVNGKPFGFNIGYGFGDTSAASENILFYDGVGHKLTDVKFNIPADSYIKPWTFTSADGRFEMDFEPVIDRASRTNALVIESDQHQVFGRFTGRAVLDDGTALEIRELMGFAEKVRNRY